MGDVKPEDKTSNSDQDADSTLADTFASEKPSQHNRAEETERGEQQPADDTASRDHFPAFRRIGHWVKADTKFSEWAIVVFTLVITMTTVLQWYEIHSGSEDTHALAVAAKSQSETLRQSLVLSQRAWLNVTFIPTRLVDGKPFAQKLRFLNTGKTPARNVKGAAVANILRVGEKPVFGYDHGKTYITLGNTFPNDPQDAQVWLLPRNPPRDRPIALLVMTPAIRKQLKDRTSFLVVYGKITYDDVFGGHHWMTFCAPSSNIQYANPPACLAYNDIDDQRHSNR